MIVEKINNKYGVSLDHTKGERLPLEYQGISHLFDTYTAKTKAAILEKMGIDFELIWYVFIFTIDGNQYTVYSHDMDYRFFNGTYKAIARKVE